MTRAAQFVLVLIVLAGAGVPAAAQTLYAIEGTGPGVGQFVGQSTCGYPNGPFILVHPAGLPFPPCPSPGPFVPPPFGSLGDVAVNKATDRIWATDGLHFGRYTPAGVIDMNFILPVGLALPGPVTGMGMDAVATEIWVTDGGMAARIKPGMSCTSPTVLGVVDLFPDVGVAQDIEYDACTATLWVVTDTGHLAHYTAAGGLIATSFIAGGPCGLGINLTGLGYDTASNSFFVTDGFIVAHVTAVGAAAPPTFWFPDTCEDLDVGGAGPPVPISGLAASLRPARYGVGSDPVGGAPVPAIMLSQEIAGDPEQSVTPNPTFRIGVEDATPFGLGFLVISTGAPCTPLTFKACSVYVNMPPAFVLPAAGIAIGAGGTAVLPMPLPAAACGAAVLGVNLHAQWLIRRPLALGGWETSEAIVFTLGER
jgi:hypothetical protein